MKFAELNLSEPVLRALSEMGFEEATSIQQKCIPSIMGGRDMLGQAQTGTGKTAAFGIPIVEQVDTKLGEIQTIVLCPTRELAIRRMAGALEEMAIEGIKTNIPLHHDLMADQGFIAGGMDIHYLHKRLGLN